MGAKGAYPLATDTFRVWPRSVVNVAPLVNAAAYKGRKTCSFSLGIPIA